MSGAGILAPDGDRVRLLLVEAVAELGTWAAVGRKVGLSRSTVSLRGRGVYPKDPAAIDRKILDALGKAACPYLRRELSTGECRAFRIRSMPKNDRAALRHWGACQGCPVGAWLAGEGARP